MLKQPLLQERPLGSVAAKPGVQAPPEAAGTASGASARFIRSCAPNSRLLRRSVCGRSELRAPPRVGVDKGRKGSAARRGRVCAAAGGPLTLGRCGLEQSVIWEMN